MGKQIVYYVGNIIFVLPNQIRISIVQHQTPMTNNNNCKHR